MRQQRIAVEAVERRSAVGPGHRGDVPDRRRGRHVEHRRVDVAAIQERLHVRVPHVLELAHEPRDLGRHGFSARALGLAETRPARRTVRA